MAVNGWWDYCDACFGTSRANPVALRDLLEWWCQAVGVVPLGAGVTQEHDLAVVWKPADGTWQICCWCGQLGVDCRVDIWEVARGQVLDVCVHCSTASALNADTACGFDGNDTQDEWLGLHLK